MMSRRTRLIYRDSWIHRNEVSEIGRLLGCQSGISGVAMADYRPSRLLTTDKRTMARERALDTFPDTVIQFNFDMFDAAA